MSQRLSCTTDQDCIKIFPDNDSSAGGGVVCVENVCVTTEDPYQSGCLIGLRGAREEDRPQPRLLPFQKRVCNSDDSPEAITSGICRMPSVKHQEIRLFAQDWESSLLQAWILQIVLSELLDVPTTIETGVLDINRNFYRKDAGIKETDREIAYNWYTREREALTNANLYHGDCTRASKVPGKYQNCAQVAPDAWDSATLQVLAREDEVEAPRPTGSTVRQALFVPKFTVQHDPTLHSYLGFQGQANRQKLADTFLRPTRWKDYCEQVSLLNCTVGDAVASRAPRTTREENRFFVPGEYQGHFRKTFKNICNTSNATINNHCTGHVADFPCGMSSPITPLLYHLDIALEGDGRERHTGAYRRWELQEIWRAANATKSHVALYWFSPETLFEDFVGSDAEMVKVSFPVATQRCVDIRRATATPCSAVWENLVGDPAGACEDPPIQMNTVIAMSLRNQTMATPEPIRSPAYEVLNRYTLSNLRLAQLLDYNRASMTPRQSACQWVENNYDSILETLVPPSYPRVLQEPDYLGLVVVALTLGVVATLSVLWTVRETYRQRKKPTVRQAQVDFLYLVLAGSLLIAIGALLVAVPVGDPTCVAQVWTIHVGYTLSLVPQIVKVAAINRLMMAARRFQRMYLDLKSLYGAVAFICSIAAVFLAVWTILDPPRKVVEYELTNAMTSGGETIVDMSYTCRSDSDQWEVVALAWNGLLLLIAVVLAIQTRSLHSEFNESQSLGNLIYANFVFLIFRAVAFILVSALDVSAMARVRSIIFSLDVVTTIAVYFLPKFLATSETAPPTPRRNLRRLGSTGGRSYGQSHSGDSSDIGLFSQHRALPRGGRRGDAAVRFETSPTNRFLRFLTGTSNITTFEHEESSNHALDGIPTETKDEEEADDSDGGLGPPRKLDSQDDLEPSFYDAGSKETLECQTMSVIERDQEQELIARQEETIALLKDEIAVLRQRLAAKKDKSSESDESAKTLKH